MLREWGQIENINFLNAQNKNPTTKTTEVNTWNNRRLFPKNEQK